MSQSKRGFTLIELLVVIAIIAILASILFPVFAKAREKARQTTCLSQVRQMATAVQMYNQDNNGRFPGYQWCSAIAGYLGDSTKMFYCPSDAANDAETPVSYGYAGILLRADTTGVNEAQIKSPTEVGVICDASPSKAYPDGGIVAGGGLLTETNYSVIPTARHSKGVIVGYCDGHAKYVPKDFNENDMGNAVTRAFYQAAALGLVDNPIGGVSELANGATPDVAGVTGLTFGGEYAAYPFIQSAAEVCKKLGGTYFTRGYLGQLADTGRKSPYVWGEITDDSSAVTNYIATNALVAIVAKSSKIKGLTFNNNTYEVASATVQTWLNDSDGYEENSIQSYALSDTKTKTAAYVSKYYWNLGSLKVTVANDAELVDKVANDPYGIGVCNSAFVDTERVCVLSLGAADIAKTVAYPQPNIKYRWVMPDGGVVDFPKLYVYASSSAGANETAYATSLNNGDLKDALKAGPLFKCSYW